MTKLLLKYRPTPAPFLAAAVFGFLLASFEPLAAVEALHEDQKIVLDAKDLNNGQQRLSEALESAAIDATFAANGIEAERATFYTNGADSETASIDLGTSYRLTLPGSHLDFSLDASLYDTSASSNTGPLAAGCCNG